MADLDEFYTDCRQCPRKCGINRTSVVEPVKTTTRLGFCREPADLRIAFAGLHFGEEPLVTVFGGSGTIFFTGCTLRCAFCQNYQISQDGFGRVVDSAEFSDICLKLQAAGAENINLVTGSHHIPRIAQYLRAARDAGVDDAVHVEPVDHDLRADRGIDLADAAAGGHDLVGAVGAFHERIARDVIPGGALLRALDVLQFRRHRADDSDCFHSLVTPFNL
jgi:hypothetical protein